MCAMTVITTKYKYIHFEKMSDDPEVWLCENNKDNRPLGIVEYYQPWKKYIFDPDMGAIFSGDCQRHIADFMGQLDK